ncbi:hypothetical protein [Paraliomyxa miuraensis]|uniref:hypothetical protein n=1 Tax=Paraliomyxa miuraensis TaxID=376150 RepID=UPI00224DBD46|nr:hypothetical protein [Paraliomyxa miuraensis]MCX4239107.1 hypothetical protein [Paraliomyxa miuraensis]
MLGDSPADEGETMRVDERRRIDDELEQHLAEAVAMVGVERYLDSPLVSFDPRSFPDPWEPSLAGVRVALRRLMRHVRLPDVPVVVEDGREGEMESGLVEEPVLFDGIEQGTTRFLVLAIGSPQQMVTWLALEVVKAWAEYQGLTRDEPLAYRGPVPDASEPPEDAGLDDASATVIGVALGLGPVLTIGTIQTHKQEQLLGGLRRHPVVHPDGGRPGTGGARSTGRAARALAR